MCIDSNFFVNYKLLIVPLNKGQPASGGAYGKFYYSM